MTQATPPNNEPRRGSAAAVNKDLDSLLEALKTDARNAGDVPQAPATPPEQPAGDVTARRVQALIRAFDVLHRQVSAIASQGETISAIADVQSQNNKAVADLQRNMRYLRAIVIQQLQQSSPAPASNLPPLNIKLLVGHLVEQYQQAERDAATLLQWAMLFAGVALGTTVAAIVSATSQVGAVVFIFGTLAAVSLAVALIFWGLARGARTRASTARRSMDESTLIRTIAATPISEPS